jgi:hypothetical protein
MSFLDPVSGAWASISGTAKIVSDPETVSKYYSQQLKAWIGDMGDGVHDGGPTDPRIGVIKLEAKLATHVAAKKGIVGRAVDTVKGALQGEVPAINSIRELSKAELAECKFVFWLPFELALTGIHYSRAPNASGVDIAFTFRKWWLSRPSPFDTLQDKTMKLRPGVMN